MASLAGILLKASYQMKNRGASGSHSLTLASKHIGGGVTAIIWRFLSVHPSQPSCAKINDKGRLRQSMHLRYIRHKGIVHGHTY